MRQTAKVFAALACALAAVSTVAGCGKSADNAPPPAPAPVLTPQQQTAADQATQGRAADAQKAAAAEAARNAGAKPSNP